MHPRDSVLRSDWSCWNLDTGSNGLNPQMLPGSFLPHGKRKWTWVRDYSSIRLLINTCTVIDPSLLLSTPAMAGQGWGMSTPSSVVWASSSWGLASPVTMASWDCSTHPYWSTSPLWAETYTTLSSPHSYTFQSQFHTTRVIAKSSSPVFCPSSTPLIGIHATKTF